jgi:predicted nucleic acid-binding protein
VGRGRPADARSSRAGPALTGFLDTNVIVRHLTGDPPDQARRATRFLAEAERGTLLLTDVIVAECVYVLESFYELPREDVADRMRAVLAHDAMRALDPATLLRALEIYEVDTVDFAEAYLAANAEATGIGVVISFDQALRRVNTVERIEP